MFSFWESSYLLFVVVVTTLPSDVSPLTSIAMSFSVSFSIYFLKFWCLICWSYYTVACEELIKLTTQLQTYKLPHAFFVSLNHSMNLFQHWLVGLGSVQLGWKQSSLMRGSGYMAWSVYCTLAMSDSGSSGLLKVHCGVQGEEAPESLVRGPSSTDTENV